ncbi:uncharacterized protein LOC136043709 [Artemia franciscana]|uniref:RNA-directed DNA polymerase n=1 Tax=Artemia franciscana TaxID=6661 RepID=A0AA88H1B3_ARTSF|nr:hypothetical protein QYM36_020029 [Artemia franciscana]
MSIPLSQAPPRLQRMMIQLHPYDITVQYVRGNDLPVADTLSRLHPPHFDEECSLEIEFHVHSVMKSITLSDKKMGLILKENKRDPVMIELTSVIQKGWPNHRYQCSANMQPYWNVRDELSSVDGIILKRNRVVIPRALRRDILQQLHVAHLGMEKSKQRARSSVYWPNMSSAIEDLIRNCEACGKFFQK